MKKKQKASGALRVRLTRHRRKAVLLGLPLCLCVGFALADLLNLYLDAPLLAKLIGLYMVFSIALLWVSNARAKMTMQAMSRLESDNERLRSRVLQSEVNANYDGLTRLPNIRLLPDRFMQAVERAKRNKTLVAMYLLTLADFVPISARYGTEGGAKVISVTAKRLRRALRDTDTIMRVSNSDFVVIAEAIQAPQHIPILLHKLEQALNKPVELGNITLIRPHHKLACVSYPADGPDLDTLFAKVRERLEPDSPYIVSATAKLARV